MEIVENKPFLPKFHQISITPLFSTSEFGFILTPPGIPAGALPFLVSAGL
jgi:hypothetical protein